MKLQTAWPALIAGVLGALALTQLTLPALSTALDTHAGLRQKVASLQTDAGDLPRQIARQTQLNAEAAAFKATLPEQEQLSTVLLTLTESARQLGVNAGKLTRSVRSSDTPGVTAVDLDLALSGSYARVQAFVQTLARLPRAYTTRAVNLTADPRTPGQVSGNLMITTYVRSVPASGAPTSPATVPTPGETP